MPAPDQIDPKLTRSRLWGESEAEYTERMARIDQRDTFFAQLAAGTLLKRQGEGFDGL